MSNQMIFEGKKISEEDAIRIIEDCPHNLSKIKNQTEQVCLEAVRAEKGALEYVDYRFKEVCEKDLKNNDNTDLASEYVPDN